MRKSGTEKHSTYTGVLVLEQEWGLGIQTGMGVSVSEQVSKIVKNRKIIHGFEGLNLESMKTFAELCYLP